MADALGRAGRRRRCYRSIHERGRRWVDATPVQRGVLHPAIDLGDRSVLAPVSRRRGRRGASSATASSTSYWSPEHGQLKYQLGEGCLVDQVLGQWHASLYGLGDMLDPRAGRVRRCRRSTATTSCPAWRTSSTRAGCSVSTTRSGTDHRQLARPRAQAGRAGAVCPGDDARHGVRVRPDADAVRRARRGRARSPRRSATATTARSATRGTRSSAAPTTRARWRAGGRSSCWRASRSMPDRGHLGFHPRVRDGDVRGSFWSGPAGVRHLRASRDGRMHPGRPGRHAAAAPASACRSASRRPTAVERCDGRRSRASRLTERASSSLDGVTLVARRAARGRRACRSAWPAVSTVAAIDEHRG